MNQATDFVSQYALTLGFVVQPKTILVEGTSDVAIFKKAAALGKSAGECDLLGGGFALAAAGERDRGGYAGVVRELVALRSLSRTILLANGRPKYRFVGLFDNDTAGQKAVQLARAVDTSIVEFFDVFRLFPRMPIAGNLLPDTVSRAFSLENQAYKSLPWELEDLLSHQLVERFLKVRPSALIRSQRVGDEVHRDLTKDGKEDLRRFALQNATWRDMGRVANVLRAMRFYMNVKT